MAALDGGILVHGCNFCGEVVGVQCLIGGVNVWFVGEVMPMLRLA